MQHRKWLCLALGLSACLALNTLSANAEPPVMKDAVTGDAKLKSIEVLSFAPDGVLLLGDGKGKQVVAVQTGDTTPTKWTKNEIADVKAVLAGRLGAMAKDIEIKRVAINPQSQTAYIAVRLLSAKPPKDLVMTIDGNGKVKEFSLENVKFTATQLPADQKVTSVTGVTWARDRVLVTALANETFANKCFSIMAPLANDSQCGPFTTETYHVAHAAWETKAPIRTMMPYVENGKNYLVGAFTCTPIVKYSVDEFKPNEKVKGISVIELGMGNTPQYMFTYEKGGKKYILMNAMRMAQMQKSNPVGPSEYWTAKVDFNILQENNKINQNAIWRSGNKNAKANVNATEKATVVPTFHGVMHMGQIDSERALAIVKDGNAVNLKVLALP